VDPKDTKGSKASYTRDVGNLKAVLSKALASGQILPLAGAAPFKRRGLKFLTSAADRVALLEGYRTYVVRKISVTPLTDSRTLIYPTEQ
jgi:hypothetical protein